MKISKAEFYRLVKNELDAQNAKWGNQYHSDEKWLAITVEELGELAESILEGNEFDFIEEAVQLTAVLVNWITSRDFHDITGDWIKFCDADRKSEDTVDEKSNSSR